MSTKRERAAIKDRVDLQMHIERVMAEMDLRYQQRFDAQTKAIDAALLAAEKAIGAALIAAEKAVTKAEVATEKRFEGVNEFRQMLSDQATQFVARAEFSAMRDVSAERMRDLSSRLDKFEGTLSGSSSQKTEARAGTQLSVNTIAVVVAILALAVTIVVSFKG
jgi:hypothetical protein